jgi:hypothetical protein
VQSYTPEKKNQKNQKMRMEAFDLNEPRNTPEASEDEDGTAWLAEESEDEDGTKMLEVLARIPTGNTGAPDLRQPSSQSDVMVRCVLPHPPSQITDGFSIIPSMSGRCRRMWTRCGASGWNC